MTLGAVDALGTAIDGGLVVTKAGHAASSEIARIGLELRIGGHPLPDSGSLAAGNRLIDALAGVPQETTLLFLISGGASSLVEVPIPGVGLDELRRANAWLLASGLPIRSMNLVRKSLSRIKAGGLLERIGDRPARVLAISDVPDDAPEVIGSGLLRPEPELAKRVRRLALPDWLRAWVEQGLNERGQPPAQVPEIELVATLAKAKSAIAAEAKTLGLECRLHPEVVQGDAAALGASLARALLAGAPGLHVWGGEPTVALPESPGRGGRNQHLALAAAAELNGRPGHYLLSAGTDGTDGPTEDAGALVDSGTLERAALDGLSAADGLRRADSGRLLEASGDLVRTGPTGTNVMDLILGLKT